MTEYKLTASYGQHYFAGSFIPGFQVTLTGGLSFLLKFEHGHLVPVLLSPCCTEWLHLRDGAPFCVRCGKTVRADPGLVAPFVRENTAILAWLDRVLELTYPPLEASLLSSSLQGVLEHFLSAVDGAGWLVSEVSDVQVRNLKLAEHYHAITDSLHRTVLVTAV